MQGDKSSLCSQGKTGGMAPPICISEFEGEARKKVPEDAWGYFAGGADDEVTLAENVNVFRRLRLRPRMLRGVKSVDMRTRLLGEPISMPICIAPSAFHKLLHPEGEIATARAAAKAGTFMILSMAANTALEDVSGEVPHCLRWFQLYVMTDREHMKQLVVSAEHCGYKAIVLTVDTEVSSRRRAVIRSQFSLPSHLSAPMYGKSCKIFNATGGSDFLAYPSDDCIEVGLDWGTVKWLQSITSLPIVLKGILTAEDAILAVEHGVQGIVVSNHGARQLDGVLPTLEALQEVVAAVKGRAEVYMDGGVRLGTDVLKALALGARAVFIGRPVCWGLAYKGEEGVKAVLDMLREELRLAMILSGCSKLEDITPALVSWKHQTARL